MQIIKIDLARKSLSNLIDDARYGDTIVIIKTRKRKPLAKIVALTEEDLKKIEECESEIVE